MRAARLALSALLLALWAAAPAHAQSPDTHQAGLVIVHGDGRVVTACVPFEGEAISGAELLRRADVMVRLDAYGGLGYGVCAIDGQGCPGGGDCFCQCRSAPCAYWVYTHRQPDGSWAVSGVGAGARQVQHGAVDGWVWGDGSTTPPPVTFEALCPAAEAPPEPAPAPTAAPLPTPAVSSPDRRGAVGLLAFGTLALGLALWWAIARARRR
jgi:hypothetical protein